MPVMSPLVMQKLLVFSLFCGTLAAPLSPRQFPGRGGAAGPPGSRQPPFGGSEGNRQWGVLYPRPRGQSPQEGPTPDASPEIPSADPVPPAQTTFTIAPSTFDTPVPPPSTDLAPPAAPDPATTVLQPGTTTLTTVTMGVTVSTTLTQPDPIDSTTAYPPIGASSSLAPGSASSAPSDISPSSSAINSSVTLPVSTSPASAANVSSSLGTATSALPTIPANTTLPSPTGSAPSSIFNPPSQSTNASAPPASPTTAAPAGPLRLSLVNNLASSKANAYVSAIESSSGRVVMLTPGGAFYYLPETGSGVPQRVAANVAIRLPAQGQSLEITIPGFVEGARVWFADGTLDFSVVSSVNGPALVEPTAVRTDDGSANTNWGFVELAYVSGYGLFANLSFVDFVGMPLGLQLQTVASGTQTVPGMPRNGVQEVCDRIRRHRGKGAKHWAKLCVSDNRGNAMRVVSPAVLLSQQPDAFPTYFQRYVDKVWNHFRTNPLTVDTQNANGNVRCRVVGNEMQCDGDNRGYVKPSAGDIFGCDSGPFAILQSDNNVHRAVVPRLCAAFNRGTFMLPGGEVQPGLPASSYYTGRPYNVYSAIVHEVEREGRGYAFSYDDVAVSPEQNVAGTVAAGDPRLLTVFVGGM